MPVLIAWAYEDSSRRCAQLTLQHIVRTVISYCSCAFTTLRGPWSSGCIHPSSCVPSQKTLSGLYAVPLSLGPSLLGGRGWIVSCPVSSICAAVEYPWRSNVGLCRGCRGVRSLALSLWIPEEEEDETKRFLFIFGGGSS
jgi:hypothetical protein